jgi:hypothetical protein
MKSAWRARSARLDGSFAFSNAGVMGAGQTTADQAEDCMTAY